jgi:hypothetical protein
MADFYCLVENGNIRRYNVRHGKPVNNIGFSKNSTEAEYIDLGYLPLVGVRPEESAPYTQEIRTISSDGVTVEKTSNYNIPSCSISGPAYEVKENVVERVYTFTHLNIEDSQQVLENRVREIRDVKLEETDVYGLSDRTMTPEMVTYRQALRDLPDTIDNILSVDFPSLPQELVM